MLTAMYARSIKTAALIDANSSCRVRAPGITGASVSARGAAMAAAAVGFVAPVMMTCGLSIQLGTSLLSLAICCE
jgi:hypothetical protein